MGLSQALVAAVVFLLRAPALSPLLQGGDRDPGGIQAGENPQHSSIGYGASGHENKCSGDEQRGMDSWGITV